MLMAAVLTPAPMKPKRFLRFVCRVVPHLSLDEKGSAGFLLAVGMAVRLCEGLAVM